MLVLICAGKLGVLCDKMYQFLTFVQEFDDKLSSTINRDTLLLQEKTKKGSESYRKVQGINFFIGLANKTP